MTFFYEKKLQQLNLVIVSKNRIKIDECQWDDCMQKLLVRPLPVEEERKILTLCFMIVHMISFQAQTIAIPSVSLIRFFFHFSNAEN